MQRAVVTRFLFLELRRSVSSIGFIAANIIIMLSAILWVLSQKIAPQIMGSGGYYFVISSMRFNINFIFPFMALIFSSVSINYDSNQGILATLTAGYISRKELVFGKFLSLILMFALFFIFSVIFSVLVGGIIWGYEDILEEGVTILSSATFFPKFIFSSLLSMFTVITLISFGFLFSILFKNIIASISISIGAFLIVDIIKEFFKHNYLLPFYPLDLPFKELLKFTENYLLEYNINYIDTVIIPTTWTIIFFCISFFKIKKIDFYA